jgi:hypothetical protein
MGFKDEQEFIILWGRKRDYNYSTIVTSSKIHLDVSVFGKIKKGLV